MNLSKFNKGFRQLMLPMGVLVVLGATIFACSDKKDVNPDKPAPTEEETKAAIKRLVEDMPSFQLVTKDGKVIRADRTEEGGWSFTTPPKEGYNYTSTGTYTFVETSNNGGVISVAASGFGSNAAGGGTISAGSYSYDMKYTFCLSADDEAIDLGLLDGDFDGVSMVIGVSGDFEKIINGDVNANDEDFADIFKAFAFYAIYDDRASGSYNVVNWITDQDESDAELKNKGFAFIFDIEHSQLFFSKSGKLTANGGSINFSGTYLNVEGVFDDNLDDAKYKEVSGVGALGCN
jgi:hypothetical protein